MELDPMAERVTLTDPVIIVHKPEHAGGGLETILGALPPEYEHFGLLVADIIRHGAQAYDVGEEDIIEWALKEISQPTTPITPSLGPN